MEHLDPANNVDMQRLVRIWKAYEKTPTSNKSCTRLESALSRCELVAKWTQLRTRCKGSVPQKLEHCIKTVNENSTQEVIERAIDEASSFLKSIEIAEIVAMEIDSDDDDDEDDEEEEEDDKDEDEGEEDEGEEDVLLTPPQPTTSDLSLSHRLLLHMRHLGPIRRGEFIELYAKGKHRVLEKALLTDSTWIATIYDNGAAINGGQHFESQTEATAYAEGRVSQLNGNPVYQEKPRYTYVVAENTKRQ